MESCLFGKHFLHAGDGKRQKVNTLYVSEMLLFLVSPPHFHVTSHLHFICPTVSKKKKKRSMHFTDENTIKMVTRLIMSSNHLCMFLAIARFLLEEYNIPTRTDAGGNLDAAELKAVLDTEATQALLAKDRAEDNLSRADLGSSWRWMYLRPGGVHVSGQPRTTRIQMASVQYPQDYGFDVFVPSTKFFKHHQGINNIDPLQIGLMGTSRDASFRGGQSVASQQTGGRLFIDNSNTYGLIIIEVV